MLLGHHMNRKQDIEYWIWNDRYDPFEQDSENLLEIYCDLGKHNTIKITGSILTKIKIKFHQKLVSRTR